MVLSVGGVEVLVEDEDRAGDDAGRQQVEDVLRGRVEVAVDVEEGDRAGVLLSPGGERVAEEPLVQADVGGHPGQFAVEGERPLAAVAGPAGPLLGKALEAIKAVDDAV